MVAHDARRPRVLPCDAEQVARAVRAPQIADAGGAEPEAHARGIQFTERQLRQPERCDRRHRDAERAHPGEQVVTLRRAELGDREAVRDVHPALEPERLGAVEDQLDLERAELSRVVQMDVDPHAVLGGESQHGVDLTDRVAVDRRGIQSTQVVGAGPSGTGEQLEHAGATQHAVLRERDDLHRERTVVLGDRRVHRLDPTEPDPRVDVDVGADRGGAVPHELGEHAPGDLDRRDAELVTPGALVPDAALRAAFAAVPLPGKPHHDLSTCACALTRPGRASRPRPSITPPAGRSAASSSASSSIAEAGWMPVIRPAARCMSTRVDSSAAEVPRRARRTMRGEGKREVIPPSCGAREAEEA